MIYDIIDALEEYYNSKEQAVYVLRNVDFKKLDEALEEYAEINNICKFCGSDIETTTKTEYYENSPIVYVTKRCSNCGRIN